MGRNLDHEYDLLKKQYYRDKALTADKYLQEIRELAEAYDEKLRTNGLIPEISHVEVITIE